MSDSNVLLSGYDSMSQKVREHPMTKWAVILGSAGALWMVLVLYSKSLPLAMVSNYPGVFAARWVQYRGIAPSAGTVLAFNIWLVLTSALEWIAVGLLIRSTIRFRSRSGQ